MDPSSRNQVMEAPPTGANSITNGVKELVFETPENSILHEIPATPESTELHTALVTINPTPNSAPSRPTLQTLPPEILSLIFQKLSKEASVYTGITCQSLYSIHWNMHGKVELEYFKHPKYWWRGEGRMVFIRFTLGGWMGERGYCYCYSKRKYRPLEIVERDHLARMRAWRAEYPKTW